MEFDERLRLGRRRPWIRPAATFLAVAAVVLAAALLWLGVYALKAKTHPPERLVFIQPGSSLAQVEAALVRAGVITPDPRFRLLALFTGKAARIKAGEYRLPAGQPVLALLGTLARGRVASRRVTIPEGFTLEGIASRLAAQELVEKDTFLALCRDPSLLSRLGIEAPSLEGYLFPDTYLFTRGTPPEEIITVMVERMRSEVERLQKQAASPPDLTLHQLLTLASIVEKETALADERPLIARVFLNRLERGMRLQADPTVIYGLGERFAGDLTREHLAARNPYNTYQVKGLPPTPIASPGSGSIQAVLIPAPGDYLYFVARQDGSHHFSRTLAEHNRAVRRYQRGR